MKIFLIVVMIVISACSSRDINHKNNISFQKQRKLELRIIEERGERFFINRPKVVGTNKNRYYELQEIIDQKIEFYKYALIKSNFSLKVDSKITKQDENYISIKFTIYENNKNLNVEKIFIDSINYDLKNMKVIEFEDVIYLSVESKDYIITYLRLFMKEKAINFYKKIDEIDKNQSFYLENGNLVIYYQVLEYSKKIYGPITIEIGKDGIKSFLKIDI